MSILSFYFTGSHEENLIELSLKIILHRHLPTHLCYMQVNPYFFPKCASPNRTTGYGGDKGSTTKKRMVKTPIQTPKERGAIVFDLEYMQFNEIATCKRPSRSINHEYQCSRDQKNSLRQQKHVWPGSQRNSIARWVKHLAAASRLASLRYVVIGCVCILFGPFVFTTDLILLLRGEIILDIEGLADLLGRLSLDHVCNGFAPDI